jgi:HKD family nuclease
MPFTTQTFPQDATVGRVEAVLEGIEHAANGVGQFDQVDLAVAYATHRGVQLIDQRLSLHSDWQAATKRCLVSIDFGITEPAGLEQLANLNHAEVRIPNGLSVVGNRWLRPPATFHTKAYAFRTVDDERSLGLVVGSANMTVSALATGAETVMSQVWNGRLTHAELMYLEQSRAFIDWFEEIWAAADPLSALMDAYKRAYRRPFRPRATVDDLTPATRAYLPRVDRVEVSGPLAAQLVAAKSLWVRTETLYHNLGPGRPGNQLDTPRGTRLFFGFPADEVPKNTVLGEVEICVPGFAAVGRSIRFANNSMDKINLPLPLTHGPADYDDAYLIFDRVVALDGHETYQLTVTSAAGLRRRKAKARASVDLQMQGGREYGLMY